MRKSYCRFVITVLILIGGFGCSSNSEALPKIVVHDLYSKTIVNHSGFADFGICSVDGFRYKSFKILNIDYGTLKLTGDPLVSISGVDADQFLITKQPEQTIEVGLCSIFTIQFKPTAVKQCNAVVSIANNDKDDNPYVFSIRGESRNKYFDFNGDGFNDVLIGASEDDEGGRPVGCAFIFFGSPNPTSSIGAANADVKLIGLDTGSLFGISVSEAGDVNNDGYDDVIIGAPGYDDGGVDSGCVFIFYGSPNPAAVIKASDADVILIGEDAGDNFGHCVNGAGDVNGDGFSDIIVGAPMDDDNGESSGCAFVFFGSSKLPSTINASNADVKLLGSDSGDEFGFCVSGAGDMNGDGFDDIIISAPEFDNDEHNITGYVCIFLGSSALPSTINSQNSIVIINNVFYESYWGYCVNAAGDINDDGYDDVIVSAVNIDFDQMLILPERDEVCIFFGSSSLSAEMKVNDADVGFSSRYNYGMSVSGVGDLNGDGFDDIVVGANNGFTGNIITGKVYVYFGSRTPQTTMGRYRIIINGEEEDNRFGYSVGCIGDMNNDGFCDIIVGTPYDDDGGENSGAVFVYFGRQTWSSPYTASDADIKIVGDDAIDRFGESLSRK